MSGKPSRPPRAAFCEDFNDETNTALPETRRSANVAAKRSKPELRKVNPTGTADGASDSGYSSRTAATVGSGDSAQSGKRSPPTLRVDTSNKERTSRPPVTERKSDGAQRSSSRPDPQRSPSKSRKRESLRNDQFFVDQWGRVVVTPLESPWRVDYPPFNYPPPPVYDASHIPQSPQSARYPPAQMWPQEVITPQATTSRPRINSPQSYLRPARPMTIHGSIMQDMMYMGMAQPSPYDHGPPPSTSAYVNTPFPYPPNTVAYAPAPIPAPAPQRGRSETQPPPYHEHRPRHQTEQPPTNRRASMYGPLVVNYAQPANGGPAVERRWGVQREQRPPPPARSFEHDEDYYRMPPPPPQPHQVIPLKKRPSVRKSATSNPLPTLRRFSKEADETRAEVSAHLRRDDREPDFARRRPSLETTPGKKPTSYTQGLNSVKVATAGVLNRSKTYHGPQDLDRKQREAEEYQEAKGGKPVSLTADLLKKVGHSERASSESESQSRTGSSRSTSDVKPKSGTVSRGDPESVTMTVNGVKFGFSNDKDASEFALLLVKGGGENGRRAREESRIDRASRRTSPSGTSEHGSVK